MSECQKCLDPTALGLFLVTLVSLVIAFNYLIESSFNPATPQFAIVMGIMALFVAYFAYKAESQFGFTVFALVGGAVLLHGLGIGTWEYIFFGVLILLAVIWSLIAKTPKLLTVILLLTALIFIIVGAMSLVDNDLGKILGVVALLNGILALYLGFAIATGKAPIV